MSVFISRPPKFLTPFLPFSVATETQSRRAETLRGANQETKEAQCWVGHDCQETWGESKAVTTGTFQGRGKRGVSTSGGRGVGGGVCVCVGGGAGLSWLLYVHNTLNWGIPSLTQHPYTFKWNGLWNVWDPVFYGSLFEQYWTLKAAESYFCMHIVI